MTRSYNATPIIMMPAMVFINLARLANCLTSQSPWALDRIETIITGSPSPRPKVRKMMKASTAERLDNEIAIVKDRITSELQGRAQGLPPERIPKEKALADSARRSAMPETARTISGQPLLCHWPGLRPETRLSACLGRNCSDSCL